MFFAKLADVVVERRKLTVGFLVLVTCVALTGMFQEQLLQQWRKWFPEQAATASDSSEPEDRLPDVDPVSLSNADAVLVVRSKKLFTAEGATAMRQVVADLESLDQVQRTLWMDRVPPLNIFGLQEPIYPRSVASPRRFEVAKEKALAHPLIRGQLLSEDAETMLVMIWYDYPQIISDSDIADVFRDTAYATAEKFPDVDLQFQVTGGWPLRLAYNQVHEANQLKYQLIGYGMIFIMAVVLFRGLRAVLVVSLAPIVGVFWTLGCIQFFDFGGNPLIDIILPILVSLVGLTDGVHLMVQIRKLRAEGLHQREAAKEGLRLVGFACFLTSLTTAIGFGSLALADSQAVREFGYCSVVGVTLCFFSIITVIPLACSTWLGRGVHVGLESSLVNKNLSRISVLIDIVLRRPTLFAAAGIVATVVLFCGSMTLEPDQRQSDELPPTAEPTLAMQHMDEAMGGLEFSRIEVEWDESVESDDPEILEVITEIDDFLTSQELIGHPLSIRNLIDAQPGDGAPAERMTMLELLPPQLKRAFYTPELQSASVTFRVRDLGIARYSPVFERTETELAAITARHRQVAVVDANGEPVVDENGNPELKPAFQLRLEGGAAWRWRNLLQIVIDLAKSLGAASIIIFITLTIVFRSLRLGLISIIPNMFPLVVTGTFLVLAGYNLEIVMVCNFTICLGIAVDDTIHFLTRYREEREQTDDEHTAIRKAFTGVGTALIMTTAVLVAGFSTVILSESRNHRIFAMMGAITIAAALFGDLVFLPALLSKFAPKGKRRPTETATESGSESERVMA